MGAGRTILLFDISFGIRVSTNLKEIGLDGMVKLRKPKTEGFNFFAQNIGAKNNDI